MSVQPTSPFSRWRQLRRYWRSCSFIEREVWDRPTRFSHWALAALLIASLITGWLDPAWQLDRHLLIGGMIAGLLLFRLVWGIFGSEFSRFSNFLPSSKALLEDVASLRQDRLKLATPGISPANALLSLLLWLVVLGLIITGLMAYGGEEHLGPLASLISFSTGEMAQRIHAVLSLFLIVLASLHFWIVERESRLTRIPLIRGMITGCKPLDPELPREPVRSPHAVWAMLLGMLLMFGIDHLSKTLGQLPMDGWHPLHYPTIYQGRCGSCHWTIHPSLMPEERWRELLHHLGDHFGQRVSLTGQEAITISSFILVHASEDWNTDAAHRFRKGVDEMVKGISDHPVWRKMHASVDPVLFESDSVKKPGNCPVCHHDALSGRFDRHAIHLPRAAS
ncbi:MAG: cytochrome b/b6 domain-containing protein, partial [Magnetococcales bacterium]|nr:cytochrome b/b6 domain-containing protein [Magnetococcales bacterium]